jgi:outer membrane protein assembly factor BamB
VGPGGTVYAVVGDSLRAVSPNGVELWSVPAPDGQVSVDASGTIYSSAPGGVRALNPDGTLKWLFPASQSIVAGPAIAPDGTIYAVEDADFGGRGMFRLDPDGNLLWENTGNPILSDHGGLPHRIVFGGDLAFVAMRPSRGQNPPALWAFDSSGEQAYVLTGSCQGQPVVNPATGDLVTGNGLCQEIQIYDAATGDLRRSVAPPSSSPCSSLSNIAAGPDGSLYSSFCHRAFWSVTEAGDQRWFVDNFSELFMMDRLTVVPDNSAVLDLGWDPSTSAGRVRAFSTSAGTELWTIGLPDDLTATTTAVFDPGLQRLDRGRSRVLSRLHRRGRVGCVRLHLLPGRLRPQRALRRLHWGGDVRRV